MTIKGEPSWIQVQVFILGFLSGLQWQFTKETLPKFFKIWCESVTSFWRGKYLHLLGLCVHFTKKVLSKFFKNMVESSHITQIVGEKLTKDNYSVWSY